MKLTTDIVLVGNEGRTCPYVVELITSGNLVGNFTFCRNVDVASSNKTSYLFSKAYTSHLFRNENDWYNISLEGTDYTNLRQSTVRIYLPQYSVDTFSHKAKYVLCLSTYVHGNEVQLGNYMFERKDALACAPVRFDGMDEYYEYLDFGIADPYTLMFASATENIRTALGVPENVNEVSSLLHVCLFVVEENNGRYIMKDGWTGGQNSVMFNDPDDLELHMKWNGQNRKIDFNLTFNTEYSSLVDYFTETYNTPKVATIIQYVIKDSDDIYYEQSKSFDFITNMELWFTTDEDNGSVLDYRAHHPSFSLAFSLAFDSEVVPYFSGINFFDDAGNLKDGLSIQASIMFYDRSIPYDVNNPFLTILSNTIQLTPDLFASMLNTNRGVVENDLIPNIINLSALDMNNINLKATNKIIQNIQVVTPSDSTKKHLLQPVFYQTRDIDNVVIHPAVTENISINLDAYKALVTRFKLQLEGVIFNEVGRTGKGIVFKVVGNMLPKAADEGMMYILDQNNDLVTTGKYTYLS